MPQESFLSAARILYSCPGEVFNSGHFHCPSRNSASVSRRSAARHRAPSAKRRAEGEVCITRLLRRVDARAVSEPGTGEVRSEIQGCQILEEVRPPVPLRNEQRRSSANSRFARRSFTSRQFFSRLLLRRRTLLPPICTAGVTRRTRRLNE